MKPIGFEYANLELVDIYEFYDRPLLFSCRNQSGAHYLAVYVRDEPTFEMWYYVGVSQVRLQQIASGAIDLHDAFAVPEDDCVYQVRVDHDSSSTPEVVRVPLQDVNMLWLPYPGEFLQIPVTSMPAIPDLEMEMAG